MLNKKQLLIFLFAMTVFFYPFFTSAKNYPDGTLIRAKNDFKVYLIKGNKKQWIKSLEIFNANNFKWKNVKIVSSKEWAVIEEEKIAVPEPLAPAPRPNIATVTPILTTFSPVVSASVSFSAPTPARVNSNLPAPDYIRADWLISQATANYGQIGQKIIFKYSDKELNKIENFRLYEKKPGARYFSKIADFEKIISTSCEGLNVNGEWMMTEAETNQCGYWAIQRITPPGGRGTTVYLSAANYSQGEYSYYVVGIDKDGFETRPSPETKLIFLTTVGIFSPADQQTVTEIYPTFKWSISSGWPTGITVDYLVMISDNPNAQNPFWGKVLKVPAGKSDQALIYDGFSLNPAKKFKTYIYGHYRQSEYDPDYISIPLTIPEFRTKSTNAQISWLGFIKVLFYQLFNSIHNK